jgi:hypothetical protein
MTLLWVGCQWLLSFKKMESISSPEIFNSSPYIPDFLNISQNRNKFIEFGLQDGVINGSAIFNIYAVDIDDCQDFLKTKQMVANFFGRAIGGFHLSYMNSCNEQIIITDQNQWDKAKSKTKSFRLFLIQITINLPTGIPKRIFDDKEWGNSSFDYPSNFTTDDSMVNIIKELGFDDDVILQCESFIDKYEKSLNNSSTNFRFTRNEAYAILLYTYESPNREESPYYRFNAAIRNNDKEEQKKWFKFYFYFCNGIHRLPSYGDKVYRGLSVSNINSYEKGKEMMWGGITSASIKEQNAINFSTLSKSYLPNNERIVCCLENGGGKLLPISFFPNEQEVIILPNSKWIVSQLIRSDPTYCFMEPFYTQSLLLSSCIQFDSQIENSLMKLMESLRIGTLYNMDNLFDICLKAKHPLSYILKLISIYYHDYDLRKSDNDISLEIGELLSDHDEYWNNLNNLPFSSRKSLLVLWFNIFTKPISKSMNYQLYNITSLIISGFSKPSSDQISQLKILSNEFSFASYLLSQLDDNKENRLSLKKDSGKKGNIFSQYDLLKLEDIEKNIDELQIIAERGHSIACFLLFCFYRNTKNAKLQSFTKSLNWLNLYNSNINWKRMDTLKKEELKKFQEKELLEFEKNQKDLSLVSIIYLCKKYGFGCEPLSQELLVEYINEKLKKYINNQDLLFELGQLKMEQDLNELVEEGLKNLNESSKFGSISAKIALMNYYISINDQKSIDICNELVKLENVDGLEQMSKWYRDGYLTISKNIDLQEALTKMAMKIGSIGEESLLSYKKSKHKFVKKWMQKKEIIEIPKNDEKNIFIIDKVNEKTIDVTTKHIIDERYFNDLFIKYIQSQNLSDNEYEKYIESNMKLIECHKNGIGCKKNENIAMDRLLQFSKRLLKMENEKYKKKGYLLLYDYIEYYNSQKHRNFRKIYNEIDLLISCKKNGIGCKVDEKTVTTLTILKNACIDQLDKINSDNNNNNNKY